jgi:hypothetical protein
MEQKEQLDAYLGKYGDCSEARGVVVSRIGKVVE